MKQEFSFVCYESTWLAFTPNWEIDRSLSAYAKFLSRYVATNTLRAYLRHVKTWLNFLTTKKVAFNKNIWNLDPKMIRSLVGDFLTEERHCRVGFRKNLEQALYVSDQQDTFGSPRQFMAALNNFYRVLNHLELYPFSPLEISPPNDERIKQYVRRMPKISGCEPPPPHYRLSNNYYVFKYEAWKPQTIDSKNFSRRVNTGAIAAGWSQRENLIYRILMETGARISEVMALTLEDWSDTNFANGARAMSKGSGGKRVKDLGWSNHTTQLLKEYFDTERKKRDKEGWTLHDYLRQKDKRLLRNTPIFISRYGTQLQVNSFRLKYWKPAMAAAGIKATIHQTRHWYVTRYMRLIFQKESTLDSTLPGVASLLTSLVSYMGWKSPSTLASYNHLFEGERFRPLQQNLHEQFANELSDTVEAHEANSDQHILGDAQEKLDQIFNMAGTKR